MESSNSGSSGLSAGTKRTSRQDLDEPPHRDDTDADFPGADVLVGAISLTMRASAAFTSTQAGSGFSRSWAVSHGRGLLSIS